MPHTLPIVLISILHWNEEAATARCLDSLMQQGYPNARIVVTDNASTEPLSEALQARFPTVTFLRNSTNLGFAGGHNRILRSATYANVDYYWILNNDATVVSGCLGKLIEVALAHPEAGLLSPEIGGLDNQEKVEFLAGSIDQTHFALPRVTQQNALNELMHTVPDKIWLAGTALLINRKLIDANALWLDDRLFAYYDDCDISLRAIKAGFRNLAVPSARILHNSPADDATRGAHYHYLMTRNNWLFWRAHTKNMWPYLPQYLANTLNEAANLLPRHPDKARTVLLAAWHALQGKSGAPAMEHLPPLWLTRLILIAPYKTAALLRLLSPLSGR